MLKKGFSQNAGRFLQAGSDPDVIEKKSGGGCLTLFGIPFFLAGLWVLLIGLGAGPIRGGGRVSRLCGCGSLRPHLHGRRRHPHLRQVRAYHRPPGEPGRPMAGAPRPPAEDRPAPRRLRRRPSRLRPGRQDDELPGSAHKGRRPRGGDNRRGASPITSGRGRPRRPLPGLSGSRWRTARRESR